MVPVFRNFATCYCWKLSSLVAFDLSPRTRILSAFSKLRFDAVTHGSVSALSATACLD